MGAGTGGEASSAGVFEPPRAQRVAWPGRAWFSLRRRFCRVPERPVELVFDPLLAIAVLCVPGLGYRVCGHRLRAGACAGFVALCIVGCLGFYLRSESVLFGGLIAGPHTMGVMAYYRACFPTAGRWRTLRFNLGLVAVFLLAATPVLHWMVSPFAVTVTDGRRAVLYRHDVVGDDLKEGDTVAAQLGKHIPFFGYQNQNVGPGAVIRPGHYLVRVVALGGRNRHVEPQGGTALLGQADLRVEDSPTGSVSVPEGCVLVWPVTSDAFRGRGIAADVQRFVLARERLLGRPYHRWFWRNLDDESL